MKIILAIFIGIIFITIAVLSILGVRTLMEPVTKDTLLKNCEALGGTGAGGVYELGQVYYPGYYFECNFRKDYR